MHLSHFTYLTDEEPTRKRGKVKTASESYHATDVSALTSSKSKSDDKRTKPKKNVNAMTIVPNHNSKERKKKGKLAENLSIIVEDIQVHINKKSASPSCKDKLEKSDVNKGRLKRKTRKTNIIDSASSTKGDTNCNQSNFQETQNGSIGDISKNIDTVSNISRIYNNVDDVQSDYDAIISFGQNLLQNGSGFKRPGSSETPQNKTSKSVQKNHPLNGETHENSGGTDSGAFSITREGSSIFPPYKPLSSSLRPRKMIISQTIVPPHNRIQLNPLATMSEAQPNVMEPNSVRNNIFICMLMLCLLSL